jgi:error-prone DNA polymerase
MFVTLEDETGPVNVIVWPALVDTWRLPLLRARLLAVEGLWQCSAPAPGDTQDSACGDAQPPVVVRHLVAQRFKDLTPLLGRMARALEGSRDFH